EGMYRHFCLVIGWRLSGHALQPQSRSCEPRQKSVSPPCGKANDLVTYPNDERKQSNSRHKLQPEIVDRQKRVADHRDDQHHHQKTGSTAGMPCDESLRIFYRDGLTRFKVENDFV